MKLLGNVLWLFLAGFWLAVGYVVAGVINCMTIIGIPFGIQSFKLAGYALWPFGRTVVEIPNRDVSLGCLGNGLWFVLGGFWLALTHILLGLLLCVTIVGIPLGVVSFRMARVALAPFGKRIVKTAAIPPGSTVFVASAQPLGI